MHKHMSYAHTQTHMHTHTLRTHIRTYTHAHIHKHTRHAHIHTRHTGGHESGVEGVQKQCSRFIHVLRADSSQLVVVDRLARGNVNVNDGDMLSILRE